ACDRRRSLRSRRTQAALHEGRPQRARRRAQRRRVDERSPMRDTSSLKDWRFSIDEQQIAWAIFDREGESQNALGRRPLEELGAIVERVEAGARDRTIAGLAILSGKEKGFIVGADVREFEQFTSEAEV